MDSKEKIKPSFPSDVQILLSEGQYNNAIIEHASVSSFPSQYIKDRNEFWDDKVKEGKKSGKKFWNGTLYTLGNIDLSNSQAPVITLGKCEYRDFAFKHTLGPDTIIEKYGKESLIKHCWVSILPVTSDGKLVCGMKDKTVRIEPDVMAYISGELNADETEVKSLNDIRDHAHKELLEESNINVTKESVKLLQIIVTRTHAEFQFMVPLKISSKEIDKVNKPGEFKKFVAMSTQELKEFQGERLEVFKRFQYQIKNFVQPISKFLS